MTTIADRPNVESTPWSIMPGWGVVADLTPPELIEMRKLRVLRKMIAFALVAVVVLCVMLYAFAMFKESSKQSDLDATHELGSKLTNQLHDYANITRMNGSAEAIEGQIRSAMTNEVDVAALLGRLRGSLPGSMSITSMNVSLSSGSSGSSVAGAAAPATAATPGTSTAGNVVGTVTVAGNSQQLVDMAAFLKNLAKLKGITAVLPSSNSAGTGGTASWSMTMSITDELLTHKYDNIKATSAGGSR